MTLSSPAGATIDDGRATGTIVDRSRITVATPAPVAEGGVLRFPVRLDHPAPSQVTARLATQSSGGRWLTEDRCGSTRIRVARGMATVRDRVRDRTRTLRKGPALTVRPRRG